MLFILNETIRTKLMASIAPTKADIIIPAEPMFLPWLKRNIMVSATVSLAPDEMPRTKGPAIGL